MNKEIEKEANKSSNGSIISIIDSNELKEIQNTSNNDLLDINNINLNENNEQEFNKNTNKGYNNEKNDEIKFSLNVLYK